MKRASFVVGVLGSVVALVYVGKAFLQTFGGGSSIPGGAPMAAMGMMMALVLLVVGLGLAGTLTAVSRPKAAPWLMLISGLAGFALMVPGYFIAGPLFVLAAILGFTHLLTTRRRGSRARA